MALNSLLCADVLLSNYSHAVAFVVAWTVGSVNRPSVSTAASYNPRVLFVMLLCHIRSFQYSMCVCVTDIVVSGQRYFFKASSDQERENWIERLQDASRITVSTSYQFINNNDNNNNNNKFLVALSGPVVYF